MDTAPFSVPTDTASHQASMASIEGALANSTLSPRAANLRLLRQVMCVMRILGKPVNADSLLDALTSPRTLLLDYCNLIQPGCVGRALHIGIDEVVGKLSTEARQGDKLQSLLSLEHLAVDARLKLCARLAPGIRELLSLKQRTNNNRAPIGGC